jgi:hypothetical protein
VFEQGLVKVDAAMVFRTFGGTDDLHSVC